MLVPAMQSIGMRYSSSTLSTPMWAAPRAPPPERTTQMRGRSAAQANDTHRRTAAYTLAMCDPLPKPNRDSMPRPPKASVGERVDERAVVEDAQVREAQLPQPREAVVTPLQHRDRRGASGDEATGCVHRDRSEAARGAPGARIEDMAMALAVGLDEALVVAARRDRARHHRQRGEHVVVLARVPDADAPRLATRLRAEDREVAREVDQRAFDARVLQHERRAVHRVFLAEAAEVELHAGMRQAHARLSQLDAIPADEREERGELLVG